MITIKALFSNWIFRIILVLIVVIAILLIIFWPRKTNTTETFTCPKNTDFVNCMPRVVNNEAERKEADRQAEYCQFIQDNCPNVQVVF